jgi:hypothetical protein
MFRHSIHELAVDKRRLKLGQKENGCGKKSPCGTKKK